MTYYTSELAAKALGIAPQGEPHMAPPCVCAMCQRPIRSGDLSALKNLPRTFMDFQHMAQSDYLCGFCAATIQQDVMRDLQRSVITGQGVYNLNTDDARAWFWLTPPEPPFAVVINHNTMGAFHYFWRTPVTLDSNLVQMNVDGAIYQVRRAHVLQALAYSKLILAQLAATSTKRKVINSPFFTLSRDPYKPRDGNGRIAPEVRVLLKTHPHLSEAVKYLETLGNGELIALSPLLKQKPATPTQPELTRSL